MRSFLLDTKAQKQRLEQLQKELGGCDGRDAPEIVPGSERMYV